MQSELPATVGFFNGTHRIIQAAVLAAAALFSMRAERTIVTMVPAVPVLGRVITLNFARSFLNRAADAYSRGDICAAGVLFREAIRRQLWAECEWHGILPEGASDHTPPFVLLKATRKHGHTTDDVYECVKEMIALGNNAAHCRRVKPSHLHTSILFLFDMIDATPYRQPANQQGRLVKDEEGTLFEDTDYDVDGCDDDRWQADWWKPEDWKPQL